MQHPKATLWGGALAMMALLAPSVGHAQSLVGSTVEVRVDYPTFGATKNIPPSRIVGDGIEFPAGSLQPLPGWVIGPVVINVDASTITLTWAGSGTTSSAGFDGLEFVFDPTSPRIVGLSIDPSSSFSSSQAPIGFTDHLAWINLAGGYQLDTSKRLQLNLTLAPVPEPSETALLATGLALLGLSKVRRRHF